MFTSSSEQNTSIDFFSESLSNFLDAVSMQMRLAREREPHVALSLLSRAVVGNQFHHSIHSNARMGK